MDLRLLLELVRHSKRRDDRVNLRASWLRLRRWHPDQGILCLQVLVQILVVKARNIERGRRMAGRPVVRILTHTAVLLPLVLLLRLEVKVVDCLSDLHLNLLLLLKGHLQKVVD